MQRNSDILNDPDLRRQEEAFRSYLSAKERVEREPSFDNARAAGKAWMAFLDVYDATTRRPSAKVVRLDTRPRHSSELGGAA